MLSIATVPANAAVVIKAKRLLLSFIKRFYRNKDLYSCVQTAIWLFFLYSRFEVMSFSLLYRHVSCFPFSLC